jgi:uncharacterized protein YyaL (SSP411 family)
MPNRLKDATSPYLRQHADNPVDWRQWDDEAFSEARSRDVPVLLSVGYSSCHWCHVMAHESFEDEATARLMNEGFVNIKVDREERPDVDAVYMEAVQALTGRGGWPMTVFLAPDGRPFYAGTYFPKREGAGLPSFQRVLEAVGDAWRERRDSVLEQAEQVTRAVEARSRLPAAAAGAVQAGGEAGRPPPLPRGYQALRAVHDDVHGGFGQAPKFPQPSMLEAVLWHWARSGEPEAAQIAAVSLDAMASGGIYDHLGGGFHRYSTDGRWLVPHFEKMLYDQAGLVRAYLHGWQLTGHQEWLQVVEETVAYVLRDLRSPDGGLCSAEDADSEGEEGRFYLWRPAEIEAVVGGRLAPVTMDWYGVTEEGNFERGASILHRPRRGDLLRPPPVEEARRALFEARTRRVRPGLDGKVLAEWNAMFSSALAEAAGATGRRDWAQAALQVGESLVGLLRRPSDGRWLRSFREGRAEHLAYAGDYAWLVDAFTRLAELSGQARFVALAQETADALLELFWDEAEGGVFTTGRDAGQLIVRAKDHFDGAVPSANSVAALALARLAALTGVGRYEQAAGRICELAAPVMAEHPAAFPYGLLAADLLSTGPVEAVVGADRPDLLGAVRRRFLPGLVLAWGERYPSPVWEERSEGLAYLCRDYACMAPAASVEELERQLDELCGPDRRRWVS